MESNPRRPTCDQRVNVECERHVSNVDYVVLSRGLLHGELCGRRGIRGSIHSLRGAP